MSTADYAKMSTDALIQRFIDDANCVGTIASLRRVKVALDGPEWEQASANINAIAVELTRRKAVAEIRAQLMENPSPDVRGWAGMKWVNTDPLWAMAAFTGVLKGMTTSEVLAWRDRVLRDPPKRPTLKEMTIPQLLERFIDGCERLYGSTRFLMDEDGNNVSAKAYNRVSGEPGAVAKELHLRGELKVLVPLLDHPLITVRQQAARYCLPVATEQAVATLEKVAATKEFPEFSCAYDTLGYWRRGEYCPFPDDRMLTRV
jgi:hypothetical protein